MEYRSSCSSAAVQRPTGYVAAVVEALRIGLVRTDNVYRHSSVAHSCNGPELSPSRDLG